jgi:hypothetical protein
MTALSSIHRGSEIIEMRFREGDPAEVIAYAGGLVQLTLDAEGNVLSLKASRLGAPEMQVITDLLRRHDLTLDRLARDPDLQIDCPL